MPKPGKKSEILEGRGTAALGHVVNPPKMYQKTNLPTERAVGRSVWRSVGGSIDPLHAPPLPPSSTPPKNRCGVIERLVCVSFV